MRSRPFATTLFSRQMLLALAAVYVVLAPAFAIVVLLTSHGGDRGVIAALVLMPIAFCYAPISAARLREALAAWRKTRARADVGRVLLELGREYRVLSRSSATQGREDHIAIGPNGIFVIIACEDAGRVTASHRRVFVNARLPWRDLVDDCRVDALRVRERLRGVVERPLMVHSVLCFAHALVAVGQDIQGVKVVQAARLARLIKSPANAVPSTPGEIEGSANARPANSRAALPRRLPRRARPKTNAEQDRRLALVTPGVAQHRDR